MMGLKHLKITTLGWLFVFLLILTGAFFTTTALVTVDRVSMIKTTWETFEEGRSEKARALNALNREIGYGGMIHHFKNYILRGRAETQKAVRQSFGGANAVLLRYQTLDLSEGEKKALIKIRKMVGDYERFLVIAERLKLAGFPVKEIDRLVKVDDSEAISGLDLLDKEATSLFTNQPDAKNSNKSRIIASLHRALGYGGFIHYFKNYILRDDHSLDPKLDASFVAAKALISQYRSLTMTEAEGKAIITISNIIRAYGEALKQANRLTEENVSPEEIDKTVWVNDKPAFAAFNILSREIEAQSVRNARNVDEALRLVYRIEIIAAWVSFGLIGVLIVVSFWVFRARIATPITKMTRDMSRLASGDLDIQVQDIDRENEIGEMARAIEVFRINALERNLARSAAQRLGRIIESSLNEIYIFDAETLKFTEVNHGARENLGYSIDELYEMTAVDLKPEIPLAKFMEIIEPLRTGEEKVIQFETIHRRKDGSDYPVDVHLELAHRERPPVFVAIILDITDRKAADRMKNQFLSTVSHELRTPLTSIQGALGLIRGGAAGEVTKEAMSMLDIAHDNSNRLISLINDILDIEKMESGKIEYDMTPLLLEPLLEMAIQANREYAGQHDVYLVFKDTVPGGMVRGDHDRLMQVLANLLSNAAKFSPEGSDVTVSMMRVDGAFRVSVTDNGPGVPEEFHDKIFEKFQQADASDTRKMGGTGLGLSITRAIIEDHGGHLDFTAPPEGGATFYFDLPEFKPENGEAPGNGIRDDE
ncbi:MAG: PAS domain S-box protein [Alphaproteobacteria bacterium]|nr:PAS domain S-box protein [Alphaproteobacteria bacterium]